MNFNPKLNDFLKEKPDITVMGIFWAGYWRFVVAIWAVLVGASVITAIVG